MFLYGVKELWFIELFELTPHILLLKLMKKNKCNLLQLKPAAVFRDHKFCLDAPVLTLRLLFFLHLISLSSLCN